MPVSTRDRVFSRRAMSHCPRLFHSPQHPAHCPATTIMALIAPQRIMRGSSGHLIPPIACIALLPTIALRSVWRVTTNYYQCVNTGMTSRKAALCASETSYAEQQSGNRKLNHLLPDNAAYSIALSVCQGYNKQYPLKRPRSGCKEYKE